MTETADNTRVTTRFLLVRHGESNVMVEGVVGGPKTCSGLSERGKKQALSLGERLASGGENSINVVYSSPLPRAIETTEILLSRLSEAHEVNIHSDLEEFSLGEADGLTWDQVRERYNLDNFEQRDPFTSIIPGADSRAGFRHRVGQALSDIGSAHPGSTILVGCHGGVISAAMAVAFGLAPNQWQTELAPGVTSITELEISSSRDRGRRWMCRRYNDTSHLHGSDLDPRDHL